MEDIKRIAREFGVDEKEAMELASGVLRRIKAAGITPAKAYHMQQQGTWAALIAEHIEDYFNQQQQFHDRYFADEDFRRDCQQRVIGELKGTAA